MKSFGLGMILLAGAFAASAQTCTTQAKMLPATRDGIAATALEIASAVKAADSAKVQADSVTDLAASFSATAYLVRTTSDALADDSLRVTQLYELDANARKTGDTSEADFACALTGSTAETDFAIDGLPPGLYAFAMVEAAGDRPWLLSLLLRQEAGAWKMAGFYPHARTAAGHDGVWYWTAARASDKAGQPWLSWLQYGEADTLLRPANFAGSSNLDKLRSERATVAAEIPELRDGLSVATPLVLKAADGASFAFTSISAEGSEDGKRLNLYLHVKADPLTDVGAEKARNMAAAKALLAAHPELKQTFDGVWIFAETDGQPPFVTQLTMADAK